RSRRGADATADTNRRDRAHRAGASAQPAHDPRDAGVPASPPPSDDFAARRHGPALMKARAVPLLIGLASLVAALGLWEAASSYRLANPAFLPPPSSVVRALSLLVRDGEIWQHLFHTAGLFVGAYAIACTLGLAVGIWMGCSEFADGLLEPL